MSDVDLSEGVGDCPHWWAADWNLWESENTSNPDKRRCLLCGQPDGDNDE